MVEVLAFMGIQSTLPSAGYLDFNSLLINVQYLLESRVYIHQKSVYTLICRVYILVSVNVRLDLDMFVRMSAEFFETIRARTTQVGHNTSYYWTFDLELCHASKLKNYIKKFNNFQRTLVIKIM